MDRVRIFVGSDEWQRQYNGELLYLTALQRVASGSFEVTWMTARQDAPDGYDWRIAQGYSPGVWATDNAPGQVYSGHGWATPFSLFRWAVPELCGFQGHAIYSDCDQWWTRDPRLLFEEGKQSRAPVYCHGGKTCVMVLDCAAFAHLDWWPSIEGLRRGGFNVYELRSRLDRQGLINRAMGLHWNQPDSYDPGMTGLVHMTNAKTQPWHPYRHVFGRPKHPNARVRNLYRELCDAACIPEASR